MSDEIRVNGNQISWGSIILKIDSDRFFGFTGIDYGDKLEVALGWGMGKHQAPRSRSRGKYIPDPVKLKGPKGSAQSLRQQLADRSTSGTSYGTVEFDIVVQYSEDDEDPITVEIESCRFVGNHEAHEEGSEILVDEIELSCRKIRRNGLVLFDDSEGSP